MKVSPSQSVKWMVVVASLMSASTLTACGKTGTGIGLTSRGYNLAQSSILPAPLRWLHNLILPSAIATSTSLSGIQLCITQMKLEGDGQAGTETEARLGLVDLGNGSTTKNWGDLPIDYGTKVSRLKVEVHVNQEVCGTPYSAIIVTPGGTVNLTKDIELKFAFASQKTLEQGDSISVALNQFVAQLEAAYQANQLNNNDINSYLETYAQGGDDDAE
jgi:hypothetical protein